jgi:hypothetical protein
MTSGSTDVSNQQLHADGSREVMHGLFKDMGKQAMALEAILRVVCGKVDRMESWMTTISFGMSELDLKLRNIAHNIDGTSAVDDDGGGKQPWTVPPPDDDIAGDRAVATVSKKIGKNSKQVRVTGMAAAIIDKLAAEPKSAADKANKKKKASATLGAETPKKTVKKKKPLSQHQQQASPAEAHTIDGSSENDVMKVSATSDAMNLSFSSKAAEEPTAAELSVALLDDKPVQATKIVTKGEVPQPAKSDSVDLTEREVTDSAFDSERSTPHSSPRDMHHPVVSSGASSTDSTPVHSSRALEHLESANNEQPSSNQEQTQAHKTLSSAGTTEQQLRVAVTPAEEEPVRSTRTVANHELMESPAPSTEQLPPTTSSQSDDPPVLHDTAQEPVVVVERVEEQRAANVVEVPPSPSNSVKTSSVPAPAVSAEVTQVSKKEAGKPRRSSLIGRVLEMNERSQNHRRRSSKKTPPPDDQTPQTPSNNPLAVHNEAKQAPQLEIPPLFHSSPLAESLDGSDTLETSGSTVEDDKFDGDSGSESSQDDEDNSSESSSSGSDDAEASTEQQQSDTIEASGSHVAAAMLTGKRTSLVAGSTISRTMTALKKLKKANMLTPEEEEELKQRAQEKWYKLKGHVKEKQKKEVANILLKRKKNVFTVSSRLELLEEKSKELFAAIKQIGNDLKLKTDLTAHESLRRQVVDMQRSLQNLDVRLGKMASQLTPEKVAELGKQLDALRTGISEELGSLHQVVDSNYSQLDAQIIEQRDRLQSIEEEIPEKLAKQAQEFEQKLQALPDFGSSIEALRRSLRRKADLKMLKECEGLFGYQTVVT